MAETVTLGSFGTLQNSSIIATLNSNNLLIETAFADCLSLSGSSPNGMQANLDMNNFQIINLPAPATLNSPVRLNDLNSLIGVNAGAFGLLAGANSWTGVNTFSTLGFQMHTGGGIVSFTDGGVSGNATINVNGELRIMDGPVSNVNPSVLGIHHTNPLAQAIVMDVPGELFARFYTDGNGGFAWGSGSAAADMSWLRITAGVLGLNGVGLPTGPTSLVLGASDATPPSGGFTTCGLMFGQYNNIFGIFYGSGIPTLSAAQGSLYLRTDGSSGITRMYVNSGTGITTTWVAVNTVS